MSLEVVLVCGSPAAGKGTTCEELKKTHAYLNRDSNGGKMVDLIPLLENNLKQKNNTVLDNVFATKESRKPFIEVAKKAGVLIRCVHLDTSIEEAQINAVRRMHKRYGKFFMCAEDLKEVKKDPNMFPPLVLFKYRKEFQKPELNEGFDKVETVKFNRVWEPEYVNEALILDYDQNIRETNCSYGYPIKPDDVYVLPGRSERIQKYLDDHPGCILAGVSNQSGIHKGNLTYQDAVDCFEHTNKLLGHKIDFMFCPHQSNPISCYCRKPQTGNFIKLIEKYKLNPSKCLFVGDQTTDESASKRIGIPFLHTHKFFN